MRRSTTKPPPPIETWTTEDVHQWLTTEVKVQETCADRFSEEEVSGDSLANFEKTDILDLGIKHGPAVKITSYLKCLKEGSQHKSQFPAYVEKWTIEQVSQWLLQHVNVYSKYAERLQEEDVSGDCLVCFSKQDLLDLAVKSGPAVKILAELRKLNNKPEPTLQPIPHTKTEHKEAPKPTQTEPRPAQTIATTKPEPCRKSELKTDEMLERESDKDQQTLAKASEKKEIQKPQNLGARRKETTVLPDNSKMTVDIEEILQNLSKTDLKKFQFHLQEYSTSKHKRIPRGKLEDKDTMDTAKLMTGHYGSKAQHVTKDILQEIHRRDLISQLEAKMGQQEQLGPSTQVFTREGNQGEKLKNLLTCGGNSLDNYNRFVVVVNKSSPEQLEYLQFLSKLKLFCVLDFDPDSVALGGLCYSYRESRVANLHSPSQYQGQTEEIIKGLNLYKQTSWVFCNGRRDLDSDSNKELDYKNWLRKSCRDVEQLVSFICNPEVLIHGRCLVIFLLLSPVETEKDPIFETYRSFIRYTAEENIITICESQSKYFKWRELIQEKCDYDIDCRSINELTLSEINGTITALRPFSQSSGRLLPSSGSSTVVLKQKDEDLMTALDILCLNQCENIYDENSPEFQTVRVKTEEEFYRGGKVKWWNFYISDKDKEKPFVKREKYENVKNMVRSQSRDSRNMCDLLTLFHHPGCGATTLAMHVMWDLRQEFRCAVLKDNTLPKTEVAIQVRRLMKLESERPSPVLLLVDDAKETENAYDLVNCIHRAAIEDGFNFDAKDSQNCKVIILNCVRSQNPKEQYKKHNPTQSQYITASLTQEEQKEFEKKLKELQETHEKPENFYSFMIMKSNFDQKYIDNLARNTLETFDFSSKKDQLFAFLALVNTCVSESEIALSLSEDFLGIKVIRWEEDSVMDTMKPYSNLLIIETVEEWGDYKGIRILHHSIASACLEELERRCGLKVSDITTAILHCDLFFSEGVVKHRFELSIQRMLIERQRKKDGERQSFSPLIEKIHNHQGRQMVQEIFVKASSRFVTSASIPQALARYLYINERDFPEALKWAEKAKNIKENPYTFDTIGQIHKSNLKTNIDREKRETSCNPENLKTNIKIAGNAITAFTRAQELANTEEDPEDEAADDESDDYPRQSYNVYGYVGVLEIAFLVFEILTRLPFFDEGDPMKKRYFQSFVGKKIPIISVYKEDNEINNSNIEVIKDNEQFLVSLKTEVKETFDTLEEYFAHIKANNSEFDSKNRRTVGGLFKKYVMLFCTSEEMKKEQQQKNPNLNLKMDVEERRLFLEKNQADTFAGILQRLDKPPREIERITECYAFLQRQQHQFTNKKQKTRETINYILSNIVLYLLEPKSKLVKNYNQLSTLLQETLQDVGLGYPFPDPYYLALLLLWPNPTEENTEIGTYVTAIRRSSRKRLSKFIPKRSTIAYFYLGKGEGLKRLVSKPKLDESYLPAMARDILAQLWWNGDIFKEKGITSCLDRVNGVTEHGQMFAIYGNIKIPVHPARIGGIRPGFSTEKVSFYLGFAINGPLAYDVRYEN